MALYDTPAKIDLGSPLDNMRSFNKGYIGAAGEVSSNRKMVQNRIYQERGGVSPNYRDNTNMDESLFGESSN